ncbi:MAG: hypothetical protein GF307_03495 [candidate division Zixibacteria bacterium]|nr:hypothetical protein [candidate division Zixibacteria bacterium]
MTLVGTYFAFTGDISFPVVFTMVNIGGFAGAFVLYILGRTKGRSYFMSSQKSYFNPEKLDKVESWIDKYGNWVIVGARFFTGVRSLISIVAGLGNMNPLKFSVLTMIGFIIWNSILMALVYILKENFEDIGKYLSNYTKIILIIAAVGVTVYLVSRYWKFKKGEE